MYGRKRDSFVFVRCSPFPKVVLCRTPLLFLTGPSDLLHFVFGLLRTEELMN